MLSNNFMHKTKKLAFLDLTHSTEGFALQITLKHIMFGFLLSFQG